MRRLVALVRAAATEMWALVVDDGLLAAAALVAIGATWVISRDGVLGPVDAAGWVLVGLVAISLVVSVIRAIGSSRPQR